MCRIAGILHPTQDINATRLRVQAMCQLLKHGGPDDEGIYVEEEQGLVLGNRRLALLDLTPAGHMPMTYRDRYVITYNGEIYNHPELRAELIGLGHEFHNHTDTEVILAAFAQWNTQSFSRLNGMFAFALWDKQEKQLYLVRDAAGIKPLYYSFEKGVLVFGSEVRAFLASGEKYNSHPNWPVMLMAYGHLPEPVTTLQGVRPLAKGCFLHINPAKRSMQLQSFSFYSFSSGINEASDAKEFLQKTLRASVKRQMLADAPMGVFLSGGLDSSILAALASETSKTALNSLSIYFDDARFSEKKYQDLVIDRLHCKHGQYLLTEEDFLKSLPTVLNDMDLPSCDGVNTWFISKFAKQQGLKGVLSGVGGDELFGGYPSFKRMPLARVLQGFPNISRRAGRRSKHRQLRRMAYLDLEGIKGMYLFLRGHFTPYEIAQQLDMDEREVWQQLNDSPAYMDVSRLEKRNQASWMEFNLYMQNQLLRDADVMSMAHGVEIRVPLLDDEIIKGAFAMDPEAKYPSPLPKQLLINAFENIIPKEIYDRPKMGFSFPFTEWLGNSEYVKTIVSEANCATQKNYERFSSGRMHWSQLLNLINLKNRGFA